MPWHHEKCYSMKHNATVQRTRPWHDAQCHRTKNNATAWGAMPWHPFAWQKMPRHNAQCSLQCSGTMCNAVACCGSKKNDGQHKMAMATSTAMQWQCQWWHQATTAQFDSFFLLKKRLIKLDYFVFSIVPGFSLFWKVSGVLAPVRLFWGGWCHHCPWWLKPVDCIVKVFLLGPTFWIGYT